MGDPTLTLQAATAMLAAIQLPAGQSAGEVYLNDSGQWMVPITDDVAMESRVVTLESLTGPTGSRIVMPGVLRGETAQAVCTPHDPSLDMSYDVSTPENCEHNLDEILRQLASCDPTQAHVAFEALTYLREQARAQDRADSLRLGREVHTAERALERRIETAQQRIRQERGPEEAEVVERNYESFERGEYHQPDLPAQTSAANAGANGGSTGGSSGGYTGGSGGGTGGGVAPVVAGGSAPIVGGTVGSDVQGVAFVPGGSAGAEGVVLTTASLFGLPAANDDGAPLPRVRNGETDEVTGVPASFSFAPVTVTLASHQIPEYIGRAASLDGTQFFQTYLAPQLALAGPQASPIVGFLQSGTPAARSYIDTLRRSTGDVLRNYWTQNRAGSIADAHRPLELTYRYDTAARGIVISMAPAGVRAGERRGAANEAGDEFSNPFDTLRRRFTGTSLAAFRLGVDGVREPSVSAYPSMVVPIPFAAFVGATPVANDVVANPLFAQRNGTTDRAPTRVAHRGDSGEHQGGQHQEDARGGRGQGRQGGGQQNPQDQNPQDQDDGLFVADDENGSLEAVA